MKHVNSVYLKAFVIAILLAICTIRNATSQFTKLVDFDGFDKGSFPVGSPVISGNTFYGMTNNGGIHGFGVIFKVNTDGTGFTKLIDFDGVNKGSGPEGSLTLSDTVMYGMTYSGGLNHLGVLFKININGTGFKRLVDFDGINKGSYPIGSLTLSGNQLYGMTELGGKNNNGILFKVNTDGIEFTKLIDFDGPHHGAIPYSDLTLLNNTLYGMTSEGGKNNRGVIFKMINDSSGFTKLFDFDGGENGSFPLGSLTIADTVLYGATSEGGTGSDGILFKENINGTGFTKLVDFDDSVHKGINPYCNLLLVDNMLYSMTPKGGAHHKGIIFKVSNNGTGFVNLLDFDGTSSGSTPLGSLIRSGNVLYGFTGLGGVNDKGVLFKYVYTNETGVTQNNITEITIYPNPADDWLFIKNESTIINKVEFINIYGQTVKSQICNSTKVNINTSDLSEGVYIVRVYDKSGRFSIKKILKE